MQANVNNFVFVLLTKLYLIEQVGSLYCYTCGTITPPPSYFNETHTQHSSEIEKEFTMSHSFVELSHLESCNDFETKRSQSSAYLNDCSSEEQICVKIVIGNSTQRGCSYKVNSVGIEHRIGCGIVDPELTESDSKSKLVEFDHICYCDTNYCNGATGISEMSLFLVPFCIVLIFKILNK